MEEKPSKASKEINEENKFKTTIHDMIYKLIEEEDNTSTINFQDKQINLYPEINPINKPYIPIFVNNVQNNDNLLFPNMIKKVRNTFPDNNNNNGVQKYINNFDMNKNPNLKRGKNRKKTYDTQTAGHNSKIEMEILINKIKTIMDKNGKLDFHVYNLIKGKFLSIIKNHKGSKIFQKYIKPNNTSDEIIHLLFLELSKNLEEFMTNPYSNYFFK